jgi:hypothetical protein
METVSLSYLFVCLSARLFPGKSDFTVGRIFLKSSTGVLYRMFYLRSEFRINGDRDRNAILTGSNGVLPVLPSFLDTFVLNTVSSFSK